MLASAAPTPPVLGSALLAAAFDACPIDLVVADATAPGLPFIFVNGSFCRTTGYAREDILGRTGRFLQGPDSDPGVVAAMRETLLAGEGGSFELVNYRRDGRPFLNRVEIAPVHAPDGGALVAFIGSQRDISHFRRSAAQRAQRQKLEALGRVAGGFAHEVNNLLQPVLTFAELLRERLPPEDAEAQEDAALLLESARTASAVARSILGLTRAEAAPEATRRAGRLVDEAMRLAQRGLPPWVRLQLDMDPAAAAEPLRISPAAFAQVACNLLRNAADAMPEGGFVHVRLEPAAGGVRLLVRDEGSGMTEEVRQRLFEPFFTTKPIGQGTGLGLAEVWTLVDSWGGAVTVESTVGRGSQFTLLLPTAGKTPEESH
ncbi:MAG: ATP-binding protein [Rubritepida sp.]|nr:ATP-binding protein [Rubritepida sp.]